MAVIAFPQKPIRGYGADKGVFSYSFTTAGGSDPSVVSGDTDMIASNTYAATGVYTITFKKRFSYAVFSVTMSGGAVTDTVHVTTQTVGRGAACVIVVSTAQSLVAHAFTGPIVHISGVITP